MTDESINLRDQVAVVRRRWRIVVACTIAGLLVGLGLSFLQSPRYRSETQLEVSPVTAAQAATNGIVMQPSEIATQVQVLLSTPVAEQVITSVGLDTTPAELVKSVTVEQQGDTRVLSVTALRPTALEAQQVARAFADEFLKIRSDQATAESQAAQKVLTDNAQKVRDRLGEIQQELPGANAAKQDQLRSEQQALFVEITQILSDQAALAASTPSALGGGGQVLVPASLPTRPAEPQPVKSALLGTFLGLVLGIGLAFVRDHFDDAVRDEARLREAIAPRPVLGRIPHWANAKSGRLATVLDPASPVSEGYRSLSTSVRFLLAVSGETGPRDDGLGAPHNRLNKAPRDQNGRGGKILLVTSPMEGEGKTSVASNLAVVAARFGLRVILVDADLRSPQLATVFGLGHPPGLSDLLASRDSHSDYLIDVEDMKLLPGGSLAPNPAELLASPRMRRLLATLASSADLVIVDSTPVARVSDALELVASSDLVLLAARHGQTRLRSLVDSVTKIQQVGGIVSGAVYVDVPGNAGIEPYGYNYTVEAADAVTPAWTTDPEVKPGANQREDSSGSGGQPKTGDADSDKPDDERRIS